MNPADLKFRNATRADVPAIVRLLADDALGAKRETYSDPLPESYYAAVDAISADGKNEILIVESQGELVGSLQITFIPYLNYQGSWRALIESVHIAETMRGKGVGSALMRRAIERARVRGCRIVQLTTDKTRVKARVFYEKLGFNATHEGMKLHLK